MKKSSRFIDITGHKFHGLTAIKYLGVIKSKSQWRCICVCGKFINVEKGKLTTKPYGTKSCGCLTRRGTSRNYLDRLGTKIQQVGGFNYLP